jgi:N-dimethylarginine dimethylaminohydrolase
LTQENRVDIEANFVHEARREERSREKTSTHEANVLPRLLLELMHEAGGVRCHKLGVRVG